jgi:hypothetical protein
MIAHYKRERVAYTGIVDVVCLPPTFSMNLKFSGLCLNPNPLQMREIAPAPVVRGSAHPVGE